MRSGTDGTRCPEFSLGAPVPYPGAPLFNPVNEMPDGITDLLRILVFGPSIIVLMLFGLACTLEGWRRRSDEQTIDKHLEH
jgi:hypothetical protein